jgi:predicted transglutaminase-like cysteine proteinase
VGFRVFGRRRWALGLAAGVLLSATGLAGVAAAQSAVKTAVVVSTSAAPDEAALDRAIDALLAAAPTAPAPSAPDLFGLTTVRLGGTIYDDIWHEAAASALPDNNAEFQAVVARLCAMPVRERARAANAWVNARIAYAPDPVLSHHWGNLATGLTRGTGEHEDIAIAKLQLLAAAGVPRRDLFLVLVRDWSRVADDALLAVRDGDAVYVLDSKRDDLLDAVRTDRYFPVVAFNAEGTWLFGRRRTGGAAEVGPRVTLSAFSAISR